MPNYLGIQPALKKELLQRVAYTAAAGQTTFAATYTPGYVDVYKNGVKLKQTSGVDYTATNGTTIVLNSGAALNDVIEIIAVQLSNPYDVYTKAQTDAKVADYYAIAVGTANALSVTTTPAIPALTDGVEVRVRTASANTAADPTITFSNLGISKTIKGPGNATLLANAWAAGQELTLRYNSVTNTMHMVTMPFVQATGAQAVTGTLDNVVITPASLVGAFTGQQSKAINGYQKLPGGIIIQWGANNVTTGGTITFPIAFTTAYSVALTENNANSAIVAVSTSFTSTTITVFHAAGGSITTSWVAIGV